VAVALIRGLQAEMDRAGARPRANWVGRGKRGMIERAQGKRANANHTVGQVKPVKLPTSGSAGPSLPREACTKCSLHILAHASVFSHRWHSNSFKEESQRACSLHEDENKQTRRPSVNIGSKVVRFPLSEASPSPCTSYNLKQTLQASMDNELQQIAMQ